MTAAPTPERMAEIRAISATAFYDPQRSPIERLFCRDLLREVDRLDTDLYNLEQTLADVRSELRMEIAAHDKLRAELAKECATQDAACRAFGVRAIGRVRELCWFPDGIFERVTSQIISGEWPPKAEGT